jgi:hypothetical protein
VVKSIATGKGSASAMATIVDREEKIRENTDRLIEPGPESSKRSSTIFVGLRFSDNSEHTCRPWLD